MKNFTDKIKGSFIALALGDALGREVESGKYRKIEEILKKDKFRYTDDTQMAIDIVVSFLRNKKTDQDDLALTYAQSFDEKRGYGRGVSKLLNEIKKGKNWRNLNKSFFKGGSYGNGGAMRAGVLALCYPENYELMKLNTVKASEITHANSLAIEGSILISSAVWGALRDFGELDILDLLSNNLKEEIYLNKLEFIKNNLKEDLRKEEIVKYLGNGVASYDSVATSLYFALKYKDEILTKMLNEIYFLRGDSDTLGAMAGVIWGAFNGFGALCNIYEKLENIEFILKISEDLANFNDCY